MQTKMFVDYQLHNYPLFRSSGLITFAIREEEGVQKGKIGLSLEKIVDSKIADLIFILNVGTFDS